MNRSHFWRLVIVIGVLIWAFVEMYPPLGRDLALEFQTVANTARKDAAFTNIVTRLNELQKERPSQAYANLVEAVGTNVITNYFPQFQGAVKNESDPSRAVINRLQKETAGKILLGLDLQGGTAFVVGIDTNHLAADTNAASQSEVRQQQAITQAIEVLRKRVDKLGVAEPLIQPQGANQILIQLPGLSDEVRGRARTNIQKAAFLELRMVHPDSDKLLQDGLSEPGYELLKAKQTLANGTTQIFSYLVRKKPEFTGEHITHAEMGRDTMGQPEITFSLDASGTEMFGKLTRENVGRLMAIVLDGELQSAPHIKEPIEGGSCRISGSYTDKEAQDLASALQNPLQVPLEIKSERGVDPTLGRDTVKSGVRSAIIGTLAVAGFMLVYYMFAGFVADIALVINIIILLGAMCALPATFTLPGIAGVVLTIGMAVDANVLIFERIREETAKGKSLRGALAAGYDRAFGTIFDSHVTTLISSIILWKMGTGSVKGFGVTLTIGVAASLFTALVVTRLIFDFMLAKGFLKKLPMLHLINVTKLDFMKLAKPAFILSWTIILIGIGYGVTVRGSKMFGTDFVGGDDLTLSFTQKVPAEQLRTAVAKEIDARDVVIQYQKDIGNGKELLRITSPFETGEKVEHALTSTFTDAGLKRAGLDKVGPSIGKDIQQTAIVASFLSLLGILLYVAFRYEMSFAVAAVVAVLHDVAMTIGWYCLTGMFGESHARQFNATVVAAILTIIGFSINDTIVIFDRIREDLKMGVRGSFRDIINQALNQTLSRTIITSGTVLIATLSLYIFGGGAINDFAFTFLIGIITGTYSSIYIASFLVLWWQNYRHGGARPKLGNSAVTVEGAAVPARSPARS